MEWMYEDELPDNISDELYSWWFDNSFVDFVRIGPKITLGKIINFPIKEFRKRCLNCGGRLYTPT